MLRKIEATRALLDHPDNSSVKRMVASAQENYSVLIEGLRKTFQSSPARFLETYRRTASSIGYDRSVPVEKLMEFGRSSTTAWVNDPIEAFKAVGNNRSCYLFFGTEMLMLIEDTSRFIARTEIARKGNQMILEIPGLEEEDQDLRLGQYGKRMVQIGESMVNEIARRIIVGYSL